MVVCGGVWWFAVVCGGLWWFAVVCGGLWWIAVVCLLVIPLVAYGSSDHDKKHRYRQIMKVISMFANSIVKRNRNCQ